VGAPDLLQTLGSRLEDRGELSRKIVRVWLDSPILLGEVFAAVEPEHSGVRRIQNHFRGPDPLFLWTQDAAFLQAEQIETGGQRLTLKLSSDFDYFVRLNHDLSLGEQCLSLFNRRNLFAGILRRMPF
jgi:hypothetical protein